MTVSQLEVITSGLPVGAEVRGIDLASDLDATEIEAIRRAVTDHGIVCFRDQDLPPGRQIEISRRFGEVQTHVRQEYALPGFAQIHLISNVKDGERSIGSAYAGDDWHTDLCFMRQPLRFAMLHAIEVPTDDQGRVVGDTLFASTAYAYETLDPQTKASVQGKRALFKYHAAQERKQQQRAHDHPRPALSAAQKAATPDVTHPLIIRHRDTGRDIIYVNQTYTFSIEGMDGSAGAALLDRLYRHITREAVAYRHHWRRGDVIMWDNYSTQHKALGDYKLPQRRLMHRTAMMDPRPFPDA